MLVQLFANGFLVGVSLALLAVGFSIQYSACCFFPFTFGMTYTGACYAMLAAAAWMPLSIAAAIGVTVGALLGILLEWCLYAPLRQKGLGSLALMLTSIGAYIVLQNVISLLFGDDTHSVRNWTTMPGRNLLGARVTDIQIISALLSVVAVIAAIAFLHYSTWGRRLRAVSGDEALARVIGIRVDRAILLATGVGSGLAAFAGVLMALDMDSLPTMGFRVLLLAMVSAIVGGLGSLKGAVTGGIFVGLVQHVAVWKISTQWQDAILFTILIAFLIFRPQGFFGVLTRKARI